ncbi:MAG: DUF4062 domain-containing protein [Deltaproteobacteria bacterium]|jgi:hypothetical protein
MSNFRIFLSSPNAGLGKHRASVSQIVDTMNGFELVSMERFSAMPEQPAVACVEAVDACDLVLVVQGHAYGTIVPEQNISFTHYEYVHAKRNSKPVLVFLEQFLAKMEPSEPVDRFRRELLQNSVVDFFKDPSDLAARVATAIHNWHHQTGGQSSVSVEPLPPQPRIAHPYPLDGSFVGRTTERRVLSKWFTQGEEQILVIEAIGGLGKSALAWFWCQVDLLGVPMPSKHTLPRCHAEVEPEGVLWWSFYEVNARFPQFVAGALEYVRGTKERKGGGTEELLQRLREGRFLIVIDGFERELRSYEAGYGSSQGDTPPRGSRREARQCLDPDAARFLRDFASTPAMRSRILMTTRLFPIELEATDGEPLPLCRRLRLGDFEDDEAVALFDRSGISASRSDILHLASKYGHHPLALRLLIGVIKNDLFEDPASLSAAETYDPIPRLIRRDHHILEVAYDSLAAPNRALLSRLAAFRGVVNSPKIRVAEKAGAGRDETELRAAVRDLVERNLLLKEPRRGVFDLHPVVRKYAYDRLLNKRSVHLDLSNYFQAYSTDVAIEKRGDLETVIELFHQLVASGDRHEALKLTRLRLHAPLVDRFHDIRTALEIFGALAPDEMPRPAPPGPFNLWYWFNQRYGPLLRSAGFADRAQRWIRSALVDGHSQAAIFDLQQTITEALEKAVDHAMSLRAVGRLSEALHICSTNIGASNTGLAAPTEAVVLARISLVCESGLIFAYSGQLSKAEEFLEPEFAWPNESAAVAVVSARQSRYRSFLYTLKGNTRRAAVLARCGLDRLDALSQKSVGAVEERIFALSQFAVCVAKGEPASSEHFGSISIELNEAIRQARELALGEAELDALIAAAQISSRMELEAEAERYARMAVDWAERGGYRPRLSDSILILARLVGEENGAVDLALRALAVSRFDSKLPYRIGVDAASELAMLSEGE